MYWLSGYLFFLSFPGLFFSSCSHFFSEIDEFSSRRENSYYLPWHSFINQNGFSYLNVNACYFLFQSKRHSSRMALVSQGRSFCFHIRLIAYRPATFHLVTCNQSFYCFWNFALKDVYKNNRNFFCLLIKKKASEGWTLSWDELMLFFLTCNLHFM